MTSPVPWPVISKRKNGWTARGLRLVKPFYDADYSGYCRAFKRLLSLAKLFALGAFGAFRTIKSRISGGGDEKMFPIQQTALHGE
jgi:hypothetical protein